MHQPNALLFEHFDRLLLLKKGGRTVYFGPIGRDSQDIRDYFARNGADCPLDANPAEFMLEAIGAGSRRRIGNKDWADIWRDSPELDVVKEEIAELKRESLARPAEIDPEAQLEYATSFLTQLRIVARRTQVTFWRNPDYGFTRLFNHYRHCFVYVSYVPQSNKHTGGFTIQSFCDFHCNHFTGHYHYYRGADVQ